MAANRPQMRKIQNNGTRPAQRGLWQAGGQLRGPVRFGGYGTVTAIQQRDHQRGWETAKAPSLEVQALAAARQRRLSAYTEAEQRELHAAYAALCSRSDISSLRPAVLEALASPVVLAELESAVKQKCVTVPGTEEPLTEHDFVMLTLRPSLGQGASRENLSCRLLRASTPQSSKPVDLAAAAQATQGLNDAILDEVAASDADAGGGRLASLKAALARCELQRKGGVPEYTMRCKCRLSALNNSRLLRPSQTHTKLQLPSGLTLEVERLPDPWRQTVVTVLGLSTAVPLAQASLMVASLLQGAPFELSTGSQPSTPGDSELSGRALMGITIASTCDDTDMQASEHKLFLTMRNNLVCRLPPVTSLLMVWPGTVNTPARSELTWVRFEVDAADGHTDPRKCCTCGEDGHSALACTAKSAGHQAKFTCFATVPPEQTTVRASGAAGHQQQKGKTAVRSKQQQQQQQQQQRQQQQTQQAPNLLNADGFAVVKGSTRAVNKQLNEQASRQPLAAAPAAGAVGGAPSLQLVAPAHVQSAGATVTLQAEQEAPIDAAIIAEGEQLEQMRLLQQELEQRREAVLMCLDADGAVAPACTAQFEKLRAEHEASLAVLSQAGACATEAVRALSAPQLDPPKGKGKHTPQGAQVHAQRVKAFKEATALRAAQLSTAQGNASRLRALAEPFYEFERALQQYADNIEQQQDTTSSTEQQLDSQVQPSLQLDTAAQHSDNQHSLSIDIAVQEPAGDIDSESYEQTLSPVIRMPADSQDANAGVEANADVETDVEADVGADANVDANADAEANADANADVEADADREPGATATLPAAEASAEQSKPQVAATRSAQLDQRGDAMLASRDDFLDQAERCGVEAELNRLRRQAAADGARPTLQSSAVDGPSGASETEADCDSCGSGSSESSESECSDGESLRKATAKRQPLAAAVPTPVLEVSRPLTRSVSGAASARSATVTPSSTHN